MNSYSAALPILKLSIGLKSPDAAQESFLLTKLETAEAELLAAGIPVNETVPRERNLLVMYAVWLYNSSKDGSAKPPALINLMNNAKTSPREVR